MKIVLPTTIIYFERNTKFFAKIEWWLYKNFNKKRSIPCGRTKKDSYLNCCQPFDDEHCYLSEDKTSAFCKCCNKTKIISNHPINLKNIWDEEF